MLLEDYEKDGIVDNRRELIMKTTAAQIYAGAYLFALAQTVNR